MQRTWRSIRKRRKGHHGSGESKHGSAAYKDKKLRKAARKVPLNGFTGPVKSGVPGRDGEEPETNIFKYIGIMLDIPDNPTTWQVVFKLLKVLVVMTVSYFALMALYFAAEVSLGYPNLGSLFNRVADRQQTMRGGGGRRRREGR